MSSSLLKPRAFLRPNLDMPQECLYGHLGELATHLGGPLGWDYNALIAVAAGRYSLLMHTELSVRPQVFTVLLGPANSGKTLEAKRTVQCLNPNRIGIENRTAGSEIGLYKFFPLPKGADRPGEPESRLLLCDEFEMLLRKMQIDGSSLEGVLRSLFYDDIGGSASKSSDFFMNVRLSILANLPVADDSSFREFFGYNTRGGLYDRFIYVPGPLKPLNFDDYREQAFSLQQPTDVKFPVPQRRRFSEWADKVAEGSGRRRLQEIARRVAVITAAMNRDLEVTPECTTAALHFADWQERVRAYYMPSQAKSADGELYDDLVSTILAAGGGEQRAIVFTKLNREKHWSRKYGSGKMLQVRDSMVKLGELVPIVFDNDKPPVGKNLSGKYMLGDQFFAERDKANPSASSDPAAASIEEDIYIEAPRDLEEDDSDYAYEDFEESAA